MDKIFVKKKVPQKFFFYKIYKRKCAAGKIFWT